jgi:hypothetical protein
MCNCTEQRWIDTSTDEGYWSTDDYGDQYWVSESRTSGYWETYSCPSVDIDLHRYKCTNCGQIGYYSSLAKDVYEKRLKTLVI